MPTCQDPSGPLLNIEKVPRRPDGTNNPWLRNITAQYPETSAADPLRQINKAGWSKNSNYGQQQALQAVTKWQGSFMTHV